MLKKSMLFSLLVLYFFSFDQFGYITDLTSVNPHKDGYAAHDINKADIPVDVMLGCYKFIDNAFVLDVAKRDEILAAMEEQPE